MEERVRHPLPKVAKVTLLIGLILVSGCCVSVFLSYRARMTPGFRWRDISVEKALETLDEASPSALHLTSKDAQAMVSGSGATTIMRFSASKADVYALARAFEMERSSQFGTYAIMNPQWIYPSATWRSKYMPAWFTAWEGLNIVASGMVSGHYALFFLVVPEGEGDLTVFLRHNTGSPSSPAYKDFSAEFDEPKSDE